MADYVPLIARAVAGLDQNTAEARRTLYERARGALQAQLRGMNPPLDEADITRERLALEEAIRAVEADAAQKPAPAASAPPVDPAPTEPAPSSLTDSGLKGFRDTVAEAQNLGSASSKASRIAREFYDLKPPAPPAAEPQPPVASPVSSSHEPEAPKAQPSATPEPEAAEAAEPAAVAQPAGRRSRLPDSWPPASRHDAGGDGFEKPRRSFRGLLVPLIVLVLVGLVGATAYWQRRPIMHLVNSLMRSSPPEKTATPAQNTGADTRPKISDRIGGDGSQGATQSATSPAIAVAQKVVLYEEDQNNPQGIRHVGSAIWKTETVSPGPGLAPELVVRADVEIPERKLRMTWTLRRNTDKALPASHTIEILFNLPADFSGGAINNVPGVLMKQDEQTRGVPLAGLAVKVTNGYFLIGLSAVEVDQQRNIQLLKERSWFDIPLVYTNGKRAILAVEKGTPGERVFAEAFRVWGQ